MNLVVRVKNLTCVYDDVDEDAKEFVSEQEMRWRRAQNRGRQRQRHWNTIMGPGISEGEYHF